MENSYIPKFEDTEEVISTPSFEETQDVVSEAPSIAESLARGAAQGASLGFSDELTGLLESLVTDKTYEQARDESRLAYARAKEENPTASMLGTGVGGLATALIPGGAVARAVGGASKAVQAAKTGAIIGGVEGGLAGLGGATGDVSSQLSDAATGAALGAATGGLLGGAAAKAGDIISTSRLGRARQLAEERPDINLGELAKGEAAGKAIETQAKPVQDLLQNIQTKQKVIGEEIGAMRQGSGPLSAEELKSILEASQEIPTGKVSGKEALSKILPEVGDALKPAVVEGQKYRSTLADVATLEKRIKSEMFDKGQIGPAQRQALDDYSKKLASLEQSKLTEAGYDPSVLADLKQRLDSLKQIVGDKKAFQKDFKALESKDKAAALAQSLQEGSQDTKQFFEKLLAESTPEAKQALETAQGQARTIRDYAKFQDEATSTDFTQAVKNMFINYPTKIGMEAVTAKSGAGRLAYDLAGKLGSKAAPTATGLQTAATPASDVEATKGSYDQVSKLSAQELQNIEQNISGEASKTKFRSLALKLKTGTPVEKAGAYSQLMQDPIFKEAAKKAAISLP